VKETTWSKLRELWAIRRHCKEIQREHLPLRYSRSLDSSAARRKTFLPGLVFASCFFGACILHVRDLWLHGWLPYHSAPLPLNFFWSALVVLDLFAAVLLLAKPRIGLVMSLVIMCADVAVNVWARFDLHLIQHTRGGVLLFLQLCFLAIMSAVTAHIVGRRRSLRLN
jgi:hypothetical protein